MMYKAGVCGHFGGARTFLDGQTVKTRTLTDELKNIIGAGKVACIDTCGWKRNPLKLLLQCFSLCKECKSIVILPALNGVKVFIPLFSILKGLFHNKVFYVVVGGWLPEAAGKHKWLLKWLRHMDLILVETSLMSDRLTDLGLNNVTVLPNFKRLKVLEESELPQSYELPYRLCTFSRILKEKGIEDAIAAVTGINKAYGRVMYTLDIYGQIDGDYKEAFNEIISSAPGYISYKGMVQYDKAVDVLKEYFLLLFPTYYYGEGFAGTLLDAFASGVPVVASDWKYNSEIVKAGKTGLLFPANDVKSLERLLRAVLEKEIDIMPMKKQCLVQASAFEAGNVVGKLAEKL